MKEAFRPISHDPPNSAMNWLKFYLRMIFDFQILTIYLDLRRTVPHFTGTVLDVGCGQSPYRFLLNKDHTRYCGIDIPDAAKFDYQNPDIIPFNGKDIPLENDTVDAVICTEVLEHVENYQYLADEIFRVMRKGAEGIVTVPWSARYHYIPFDYFRYTPPSLKTIFSRFSETRISNRGTDITTIANKLIILWFRNLFPAHVWKWILVPAWVALLPVLAAMILAAHVALWFNMGSADDPLGYTVIIKK